MRTSWWHGLRRGAAARKGDDTWDYAHHAQRRAFLVHTNDGILAAAGILQGLLTAGATGGEAIVGALATMTAGGLVVATMEFGEAEGERAAQQAIIDDERRRLELSPAEELAELAQLYEAKGLSASLAGQVAEELTAADALGAQLEAEYGLSGDGRTVNPWRVAAQSAVAFVVGAMIPLLLAWLLPSAIRGEVTLGAVLGALALSGWLGARSERSNPVLAVLRGVGIGLLTMGITVAAGSLVAF